MANKAEPEIDRSHKVAWAAGFMDGEGSFMIAKQTTRGYGQLYVRVSADQVRQGPLEVLVELFGGHIYKRDTPNYGITYSWVIQSNIAAVAVQELLPYLVLKQRQGEIVLEFQQLIKQGRGVEHLARREALRTEIMFLNKKRVRRDRDRLSEEAPTTKVEGDAIVGTHANDKHERVEAVPPLCLN